MPTALIVGTQNEKQIPKLTVPPLAHFSVKRKIKLAFLSPPCC